MTDKERFKELANRVDQAQDSANADNEPRRVDTSYLSQEEKDIVAILIGTANFLKSPSGKEWKKSRRPLGRLKTLIQQMKKKKEILIEDQKEEG